ASHASRGANARRSRRLGVGAPTAHRRGAELPPRRTAPGDGGLSPRWSDFRPVQADAELVTSSSSNRCSASTAEIKPGCRRGPDGLSRVLNDQRPRKKSNSNSDVSLSFTHWVAKRDAASC